jgi:Small-conductance mechanosensitive channel
MAARFLTVLFFGLHLLVTGFFAPALAQAEGEEISPAVVAAQQQLDEADAHFAQLGKRVDENATDDAKLVELKVEVEQLVRSMLEIGVSLRPRLTEVKSRIDLLGPPPAEGEPAEPEAITAERKELATERAMINQLTGRAENIAIKAGELADKITATRRALFTNTLFRRTEIDSKFFSTAATALGLEVADFKRTVGSWLSFVISFKLQPLLASIFFSLVSALFFVAGGYRLFGRMMRRDPAEEDPHYLARLSVALWSSLIPFVALAALFISIMVLLESYAILRADITPMLSALLGATLMLSFVTQIARAILAPNMPRWRLIAVSDRGARTLFYLVFLMALVIAADYVLGSVSEALGSPVVLTAAKSFFATIVMGLILIFMSRVKPMQAEAETEEKEAGSERLPQLISVTLMGAGIFLILSSVTGYIGLSRFVSIQIVQTGAILATMYIGFLAGQAVTQPGAFAETGLGRRIARRWAPKPHAMDQIGLGVGLFSHLVVLLIGVPLILLQWGFQIQDIQLWFYRAFTDVRIGGISISLSGILVGVLIFAGGVLLTRWFQRWLDRTVMARGRVDVGVRNSIRTGIGYLGIAIAVLFGVLAAGINLSSLALVAGGLSLGIGFGLQNIVQNFVSGLILLAERPFKVGDWVVAGSAEGFVKKISVRATEIETFQRQTIIVPNAELINASVGNWTHRNSIGRADVSVGVAYTCDPRHVLKVLEEIALAHPLVLRNPAPAIQFAGFGDFALLFEVKVFVADVLTGGGVKNDLRLAIFDRFKEEGIEIPFPQQDMNVHFRDLPEETLAALAAAAAQARETPRTTGTAGARRKVAYPPDEEGGDV